MVSDEGEGAKILQNIMAPHLSVIKIVKSTWILFQFAFLIEISILYAKIAEFFFQTQF